jgi:hypothetical protein
MLRDVRVLSGPHAGARGVLGTEDERMRHVVLALAALMLGMLGSCVHLPGPPLTDVERRAYAQDDAFRDVRPGMSVFDALHLLGQPTSSESHWSGKAFIPYYYGDDRRWTVYHYRGRGRLIVVSPAFSLVPVVRAVEPDPEERG